ncbi:uncharacterized protein LOC128870344 [Anastrepha ludens]|uniref:uncharacterized protein LOC128870344 n=1 Tax=Anastrepha ludens TaxID=28586 RepID=UPI0023B177BE|nr:uncharacterized protein LOC128870344 [Anastrepha ludens]
MQDTKKNIESPSRPIANDEYTKYETEYEVYYILCDRLMTNNFKEDIANYCASLSSPEQIISPPPTTVALSTKVTTKRLYTRESVMHDNDASRVPEAAMNRLNDARRIPNKQTNRHSISEKLRHYERRDNFKNSDIVDRRQSFPNILDKSGVVSASLQIPVPVAQPGLVKFAAGSSQDKQQLMLSSEQSVNDLKEVYNNSQGTPKTVATTITSSYDYSEIPYIEDTITSPELEILNQLRI